MLAYVSQRLKDKPCEAAGGCEHPEDSHLPVNVPSPGTLTHHVVTPVAAPLEEPGLDKNSASQAKMCMCTVWHLHT